jgi:multiple sugar transport system permease protein/sn-glycerol 3-phosphate transport system permease protein
MISPDRLVRPLGWFAASLLGLVVLAPFVIGVVASLLDPADLLNPDMATWSFHPVNYLRVFTEAGLGSYFVNSIVIALTTTAGTMVTSILAAYAFARMEFRGRTMLFWTVVATLTIPELICVIPNYLLMAKMKLVPSIWAAVLPQLSSGFVTFFLRQHFMSVPKVYEEAARIDGAGTFKILIDVIIPVSWAAIASMALFAFIAQWNSYLWPLIVLRGDTQTVQIALANLQASVREQPFTDWPLILAASCVVLLPSIVFFFFAERQLVQGAGLSGIK